jgi:hypothetical protein
VTAAAVYRGVPFQFEERSGPACFVLGVRKSGSSFFNLLCRRIARINGVPWIDLPGAMFRANISVAAWQRDPETAALLRPGHAYGGYRDCPLGLVDAPLFRDAPKLLLVRDPRDALVSEYFSVAHSHSLPPETGDTGAREELLRRREAAQAMSVERFALSNAERMATTLMAYAPLLADPRLTLLRYEEVVFDKGALVDAVAARFGWSVRPRQRDAIVEAFDARPAVEDPHAFVRRVTPGDHREKLSAGTIAELDAVLAPAMRAFGYR